MDRARTTILMTCSALLVATGGAIAQQNEDQNTSPQAQGTTQQGQTQTQGAGQQRQTTTQQQGTTQPGQDTQTQGTTQEGQTTGQDQDMGQSGASGSTSESMEQDTRASTATQQGDMEQDQTQQRQRQAAATQSKAGVAVPFVMFVVPAQVATTSNNPTQGGCWAQLFEDQNYQGDTFTLVGPVDMANMTGPFNVNWEDVSSIKTGPQATVTVYDNVNFRDRAAKIQPGQEVPELSEKLGFFEQFRSMRINCPASAGGQTG